MGEHDTRRQSSLLVDGITKAPSRAMLRAVGFGEADFHKPQVGIASTWSPVTPCNMHIDALADAAAVSVDAAGGKAVVFNTITISDGSANGTEAMKYSLVSRELIADSIETVAGCQGFDGLIAIGGCDKNMPGCLMAIGRLDRPALFVYGGTIRPGKNRVRVSSAARPGASGRCCSGRLAAGDGAAASGASRAAVAARRPAARATLGAAVAEPVAPAVAAPPALPAADPPRGMGDDGPAGPEPGPFPR